MAMTGRFGDQTSLDSYLTTLDSFTSGEPEGGELEADAEEGVEEETVGRGFKSLRARIFG